MKALIVEDAQISLKALYSMLKKNSYEVVEATSGVSALKILEEGNSIDIIISDIMMPHMDGFTLTRKIKSNRKLCRIPIVLCTSQNDKNSIIKGIELGIADYIVKPIKESILIPKLNKVIESKPGAIMIVDGEDLIRGLISKTLEREGYKVIEAFSGEDALGKIKDNKIALVISDIKMPKMDGFELLIEIKELDSNIPIIMMSWYNEFSKEEVISSGGDGFISKPLKNTEIINSVQKYFRR